MNIENSLKNLTSKKLDLKRLFLYIIKIINIIKFYKL